MAETLKGKRLKKARPLNINDIVINWGSKALGWIPVEVLTLNRNVQPSKKTEILALKKGGFPIPPISTTLPKEEGWIGRSANHTHGRDFLRKTLNPAFWVKRLDIVEEYRLHVFNYDGKGDIRILRWGKKVPRGPDAHPWVRSDAAGWRLSYALPSKDLPRGLRPIAKKALQSLGYDWGAVDMGLTSEGKPVIFEINSAPGLDEGGKTIKLYAKAISERLKSG